MSCPWPSKRHGACRSLRPSSGSFAAAGSSCRRWQRWSVCAPSPRPVRSARFIGCWSLRSAATARRDRQSARLARGSSASTLAWLRQSPGKPSAKSVLAHLERLTAIREIGLPPDIGRDVPLSRVSRIARKGAQTAVYQIQEYETERRHATMFAILVDTAATITDEILNLHDR